jgi:uncharacterized protein YpmB
LAFKKGLEKNRKKLKILVGKQNRIQVLSKKKMASIKTENIPNSISTVVDF